MHLTETYRQAATRTRILPADLAPSFCAEDRAGEGCAVRTFGTRFGPDGHGLVTGATDGSDRDRAPIRVSDRRPEPSGSAPGAGAPRHESGQLVVTLSGVILAVTHCGFGPAKPG
jgi:hypothetical protein